MSAIARVSSLRGCIPAVICPMKNDERKTVDYEAAAEMFDFLYDGGVDAVIVNGTTGEAATLSDEERSKLLKVAIARLGGKIPVIDGTGTNNTRTTISRTEAARDAGADAALVCTPYYNRPNQDGLKAHYKAVAEAVPEFPIILYNVPGRTGCDIKPATVAALSRECSNIVGTKEACGDPSRFSSLRAECLPGFKIYSGEDDLSHDAMRDGCCDGAMNVSGGLFPQLFTKMCHDVLEGKDAAGQNEKMKDLYSKIFSDTNPIPIKRAMGLMGFGDGEAIRLPLLPLDDAKTKVLSATIETLKAA